MKSPYLLLIGIVLLATFAQCRKKADLLRDIDLSGRPLKEVQTELRGRWELKRISGGLCSWCAHTVQNNPYMILSDNRIVLGDDSAGIVLDAPLSWREAYAVGGFWALGYPQVPNTPPSEFLAPLRIQNDTLYLQQDYADGVVLHYTRSR